MFKIVFDRFELICGCETNTELDSWVSAIKLEKSPLSLKQTGNNQSASIDQFQESMAQLDQKLSLGKSQLAGSQAHKTTSFRAKPWIEPV